MLSRTQARRKRVGGLVVTHGHHQVRIVCGMVVRDNYRVFPYEYSPQLSFFPCAVEILSLLLSKRFYTLVQLSSRWLSVPFRRSSSLVYTLAV